MANILLEAGTNEVEILIFRIGDTSYGINVAKVREMIPRAETTAIPRSHYAVEGTFILRDQIITLVNLPKCLDMELSEETEGMIIVAEFNKRTCGVLVETLDIIQRFSWDQVQAPSEYLIQMKAPVTGIVDMNGGVVQILDFETIMFDVFGGAQENIENITCKFDNETMLDARLLVADDSETIRTSLNTLLTNSGFKHITLCHDGEHAWNTLEKTRTGEIEKFDIILTDIEMPRIDGLHLTARIKEDPDFGSAPVIIFSSLITEDNRRKGEAVGADAQVTKFEGDELLQAISGCLCK